MCELSGMLTITTRDANDQRKEWGGANACYQRFDPLQRLECFRPRPTKLGACTFSQNLRIDIAKAPSRACTTNIHTNDQRFGFLICPHK